jgi:RNA polymerase sigma factor (sigma-70 family)
VARENIQLRHFVKTSDAEAFSEIVQRHAGLVYGACLRVLLDRDKAADATQETFLELLRNAEKITGSLSSWLHRVATRRAINMVIKDSSRRRREAKYATEKPLNSSRWEDISTYIDEGLDDLDEEMREILIGHFFEGRTTVEIAADKGISQPTVSRRIEAGIGELRENLRKRGVVVALAGFSSLLTQNAVEAAPALVLKELGKIAIAGANAAAASGIGSASSVSGAGAKAVAGGVLAGIKAKVISTAVVAAVGVGGIVTYNQFTKPVEQPQRVVLASKPVSQSRRVPEMPKSNLKGQEPPVDARGVLVPEEAKFSDRASKGEESVVVSKPVESQDGSAGSDIAESNDAGKVFIWKAYGRGFLSELDNKNRNTRDGDDRQS